MLHPHLYPHTMQQCSTAPGEPGIVADPKPKAKEAKAANELLNKPQCIIDETEPNKTLNNQLEPNNETNPNALLNKSQELQNIISSI